MVDSGLRAALLETMSGLMSTDQSVRTQAEGQIKALEVTDEFGLHLTELTLQQEGALPVRQLASVLLKQYIDVHWCQESSRFRPPETPTATKASIRAQLPLGLKESISKVRNTIAFSVAAIAHWDWPDAWPQLFDILMEAMKADNEFAVQGAVRVLKELSRDLTDNQVPSVAPIILPDIYRIFCESERFTVRTRSRAVEIFTTLTTMICTMGEVNKSLQKSLLNPVLTTFSEALVASLCVPDSHTSDAGLRTEVLKALTVLVKNVPKQMAVWLPQILPTVWSTLTTSAEKYVREVVNEGGDEEDVVDSDGEVLGFENLVFAIFEFVHALVETPKFKGAVKTGLSDLVYYIVLYMQITEEQCTKWSDNPDSFVEDEDEDTFAYSVRISSQDLLMALCEEFEQESCSSLAQAIERHVGQAAVERSQGKEEWWKIHEAAMLALGSVQEFIESQIKEGHVHFDLGSFMTNVVLADLNSPAHPFLLGRCLWVGSRFPSHLQQQAITSFLEGTVRGLQQDQPHPVRISAVRAIWGFCNHLRASKGEQDSPRRQLLIPLLPALVDGLVAMASNFSHSSEILGLILENLAVVLACDQKFTAAQEAKVSPLAIAMFLKYNSDPVITSLSQDIFKVLSSNPECAGPLQSRLVPPLISILNASEDKSGLKGLALEVLSSLVRSSPKPLSEALMLTMFPAAIQVTLTTDDNTVLQAGGECIRSYLSVAPDQVVAFTDNNGKSGIIHVIAVAEHLLNPVGSEFSATFVGRLVTTLIQRLGPSLGDHLDLLLKAVLSKLQGAQTLTVAQSLIMVYAHLVHSQIEAVLQFLSSVPGPSGDSALHFVLAEWVAKQQQFFGSYESKVTITAIAKLLQHGVNSNDSRLTEITVKGDQVFGDGRATRSTRKVEQWTQVPLLAKLFKLLVNEMQNLVEEVDDDGDDDSEDEGWDDDSQESDNSQSNGATGGIDLSQLLAPAENYMEDVEEEDPDCKSDPLYSMDIKQYLVSYLREFCQQPYFNHFAPHLNPQEAATLQTLQMVV